MPDYTNRTFICSVLFLDIVEYSARSVAEQIRLKERFNAVLMEAITGVATDDRIILDTGDGAAVSFLGDPEDALFAGMSLRDAVPGQQELASGGPRLHVREHEVYAIGAAPSNLRRTLPPPAPKPAMRLPSFRIPELPRLNLRGWAAALRVNSKLLVAAPLAFTLVVGTGVVARGYRNSDGEAKPAAASKAEAPPVKAAAAEPTPPPKAQSKAPKRELETVVATAPGSSRDAVIHIVALPWAEVYVDGARQGVSPPLRSIPIKPGKHRVELRNSSFPSHIETVDVRSGAEISIRHRFRGR